MVEWNIPLQQGSQRAQEREPQAMLATLVAGDGYWLGQRQGGREQTQLSQLRNREVSDEAVQALVQ